MSDIRKIVIIFVVAILFAVLVFSVIEAIYPSPTYEDFCTKDRYSVAQPVVKQPIDCNNLPVLAKDQNSCSQNKGFIRFNYDSNGCAVSYECDTCQFEYDNARERYNQYVFYISAILSLLAIFVGLYLPAEQNTLNEWIGTGFMLGGAFSLIVGTVRTFTDLGRYIRPIIILLELILVIYIAYKKVSNLRSDKKKK